MRSDVVDQASIKSNPPFASGRRRRMLRRFAILFIVGVVLWLVSSALVTWKLSHRLRAPFKEPAPAIVSIQETRLTTLDGEHLGAWWIEGKPDRPAIVAVHGIRASRTSMIPLIEALTDEGYGVLAITLRANGDSSGEINDVG